MAVDYSRHEDVFHPVKFGDRRVDIIGVGAIGSKVALSLAKLGVRNLHAWDFDTIEEHNIANQAYDIGQVGDLKARALYDIVEAATATRITAHPEAWEGQPLGEVVFATVDTMKARRELFEKLRLSYNTKLVVDTRMGADSAQLLAYDPRKTAERRRYENTLFDDDDAHVEVSACGTAITVGPTGDIIVGYAAWLFINYVNDQPVTPELLVGAREPGLVAL